jgi:hypothetical protein
LRTNSPLSKRLRKSRRCESSSVVSISRIYSQFATITPRNAATIKLTITRRPIRRACGTHRCGSGSRAPMCRPIGASARASPAARQRTALKRTRHWRRVSVREEVSAR